MPRVMSMLPVHREEVLAVEAGLLHLLERADGLGFTYGHAGALQFVGRAVALHSNEGT